MKRIKENLSEEDFEEKRKEKFEKIKEKLDKIKKSQKDNEETIDAYISMYDRSKQSASHTFYKEDFIYDEDDDSWKCPTGKQLEFIKEYISKGKKYTQYGCTTENCIFCPHNANCIQTKADKKRGYRTLDDDGYALYRKEMHDKMKLDNAKKIYSKRAGSVEPVFGQIKQKPGLD